MRTPGSVSSCTVSRERLRLKRRYNIIVYMSDPEGRIIATEDEKLKAAHTLYAAYLAGTITGDDYQRRYADLITRVYVDEILSFLQGLPPSAGSAFQGNSADGSSTGGDGAGDAENAENAENASGAPMQGINFQDPPATNLPEGASEIHDTSGGRQGDLAGLDPIDLARLMRQDTQKKTASDYRWVTLAVAVIFVILLLLLGIILMSRYRSSTSGTTTSGLAGAFPAAASPSSNHRR